MKCNYKWYRFNKIECITNIIFKLLGYILADTISNNIKFTLSIKYYKRF